MAMPLTRRTFLGASGAALVGWGAGCAGGPAAPARDPGAAGFLVRQDNPFNAEPPLGRLPEAWITPLENFYVRRHGTAPRIDAPSWRLRVEGLVERPLELTLESLQGDFPKARGTATLQCAGNRRRELTRIRKVGGVQWDAGAIGNAEWAGARLADLLQKAGVKAGARHVAFTGGDACAVPGGSTPFGASIPIEKAVAPETLLAYEMNGGPLSVEHGFPARTLVPGFFGARSVKWIRTILVSERPSDNFFHAKAYRIFGPDARPETAAWDQAEPLGPMNTNSAICEPAEDGRVQAGPVRLSGYAIAATGRGIAKVEVSADNGASWTPARLRPGEGSFAWRLWDAELSLGRGPAVLAVRATDSGGDVQPEAPAWNFPGYLCNGWHRVPVTGV